MEDLGLDLDLFVPIQPGFVPISEGLGLDLGLFQRVWAWVMAYFRGSGPEFRPKVLVKDLLTVLFGRSEPGFGHISHDMIVGRGRGAPVVLVRLTGECQVLHTDCKQQKTQK